MAVNTSPIFVLRPHNESIKLSAAATDADGAGSTLLYTAASGSGSRIHAINVTFSTTNANNSVLRLFRTPDGSTFYNILEIALPAWTQTAGVPCPNVNILDYLWAEWLDAGDRYLTLNPNERLYCSLLTSLSGGAVHITAWGGDFE